MPEGPEVKRCSEVVEMAIGDKVLSNVELVSGKLARLGVKDLDKLVLPAKILRVFAKGKSIFIQLEGEHSLVSTLGMSGWWYPPSGSIRQVDLDEAYYNHVINEISKVEKHTRLRLITDDGSIANYVDPRNFGNFYVVSQGDFERRENSFGHDTLNERLNIVKVLGDVKAKYAKIKKPIGEVLLDQTILAGLGNIYRAETMYLAKVSPHRPANSLTELEIHLLVRAYMLVLGLAYDGDGHMKYGPTEMLYFLNVDTEGRHVSRHLVYGCNIDIFGNPTKNETIGGRTCWWVPAIQN